MSKNLRAKRLVYYFIPKNYLFRTDNNIHQKQRNTRTYLLSD